MCGEGIFPSIIILSGKEGFTVGQQDFIVIYLDDEFRIVTSGRLSGHIFIQEKLHEYLKKTALFSREYAVCGGGTLRYDGKERDHILIYSQSGEFGDFDPEAVKEILENLTFEVTVDKKRERKPVEQKLFTTVN